MGEISLAAGLAAHRRMLELVDTDSDPDIGAGVEHALKGARIFLALQQHFPPQPDWVMVHEEQCCRYGTIWIHRLLLANPEDAVLARAGLELLNRLEELHEKPLPWLAAMRADMDRSCRETATATAIPAVGGLCPHHWLLAGLRRALPDLTIQTLPPLPPWGEADEAGLRAALQHTSVLVVQRIELESGAASGLAADTLRGLLPPACRTVILPGRHDTGLLPWTGRAQDPSGRLKELEAAAPLGPHHDFLAMAAVAQGVDLRQLLEASPPPALLEVLRQQHLHVLEQLRIEEATCGVGLADWIEQEHRQQPLLHTPGQLTEPAQEQLLRRVLKVIGLPPQVEFEEELFVNPEPPEALSLPIHPWVRQALQLDGWAAEWGQRQGQPLPIATQLGESMAFYQQHPWLIEANRAQPKLRLAQRCLRLLTPLADLLHLHGFKCAGSTFIWSLEHASKGGVAYVESEASNQRLAWERVHDHFATAPAYPQLITSHLITLPPPGALARLKVAFLRDPLARLASAYRFELHLQGTIAAMSFQHYIEHYCRGLLTNFQTRHLSPQDPDNWRLQQGWAARPELIDLERQDLFVGLVERYDESIVALEHALEQLGCPLDLAYPQRMNTTDGIDGGVDPATSAPAERLLEITELDANLYRRATARLNARLAAIPDLTGRLAAFAERCAALRQQRLDVQLKPSNQWTILEGEGKLAANREGS